MAERSGGPDDATAPLLWRWLPADDLLRQRAFRRIWLSVLFSSLGGQVTMLALPLTAALLLHATPTQMGWLVAMETLPFVLLALPAGVWLDRVAKLPVYLAGDLLMALAVLSVPLAWWAGQDSGAGALVDPTRAVMPGRWLDMGWLYAVAFLIGAVNTVAGSAGQIVLTQVVGRERLVEAFARNALAGSAAEVAGPGLAGALIKLVGGPLALLVDALMLLASAAMLRGVPVIEWQGRSRSRATWRRRWPWAWRATAATPASTARANAAAREAELAVPGRPLVSASSAASTATSTTSMSIGSAGRVAGRVSARTSTMVAGKDAGGPDATPGARVAARPHFGRELVAGLRFVAGQRLLVQMAALVALWQCCHHCAFVVQILFATRSLGLSEQAIGLSYIALGAGSVLGGLTGSALSRRLGPGRALMAGMACTAVGWLAPVLALPALVGQAGGVIAFVLLLLAFAVGATWIFVNFISLRQALTPAPLLGRMTTTMRWLILLPAAPGAWLGGWLGEHVGLWAAQATAGTVLLLGLAWAWRHSAVPGILTLPRHEDVHEGLGAEAAPGSLPAAG